MKKVTIIIALLFVTGAATFAGTVPEPLGPTEEIQTAFKKSFAGASNVNWKQNEDLYFANFQINHKEFFAAYNSKGELLGMSRTVELADLPLALSMSLKDQYKDYEVFNSVTEIASEGSTSYYVTAEGATKILKLKCTGDGQITVEEKIKKKTLVGRAF
jgi:hypothetical protein